MAPKARSAPAKAAKKAKTAGSEEQITVQMVKLFGDGTLNEDTSEVIGVVAFPEGVPVAKVAVSVGASSGYGEAKANVLVSVPSTLEELDGAFAFAHAKAEEYFNTVAGDLADSAPADGEDEEDEEETPPKPKRGSKSGKSGKTSKKAEPEDEDDEADEDAEDAEDDGDDDGAEIDEDDIRAMKRDQLEEFITEQELDIDPDDFKKGKAGNAALADAVIEAMSEEGDEDAEDDGEDEADEDEEDAEDGEVYTEEDLADLDIKDLTKIWKEWDLGALPKAKTDRAKASLMRKKILEAQEAGDDDEGDEDDE